MLSEETSRFTAVQREFKEVCSCVLAATVSVYSTATVLAIAGMAVSGRESCINVCRCCTDVLRDVLQRSECMCELNLSAIGLSVLSKFVQSASAHCLQAVYW